MDENDASKDLNNDLVCAKEFFKRDIWRQRNEPGWDTWRTKNMEMIIFIGLQASGKSSFYREGFFKTHMRINLDMLKTRNREKLMIDACLSAKQPLVIDNTNPTRKEREVYISEAKENRFKVIGYYFQSSIKECLNRNNNRTGKECIDEKGVLGTYSKLQLPNFKEGFDELYFVRMENEEFIVEGWKDEV